MDFFFEATSSRPSPQTEGTCSTLTQPLREGEKIRALLRARTFKSQNPFFIVAMLPSYIRNRLKLVSIQYKNLTLILSSKIENKAPELY